MIQTENMFGIYALSGRPAKGIIHSHLYLNFSKVWISDEKNMLVLCFPKSHTTSQVQ